MIEIPSEENAQKIWHHVLQHLPVSFAKKALFRQKCYLVGFEKNTAVIGFDPPDLMNLIIGELPKIESAFESTYKSRIKVRLVVKPKDAKTGDTLTYQLGKAAILKSIDNLDSSTRALLWTGAINFFYNGRTWWVVVVLPSQQVLKRVLKRTKSITARIEKTFSTFMLSFCTNKNLVLPLDTIEGKVKKTFLINHVSFLQIESKGNLDCVHIVPSNLFPPQTQSIVRRNE